MVNSGAEVARSWRSAFALSVIALVSLVAGVVVRGEEVTYAPDRVIVKFRAGTPAGRPSTAVTGPLPSAVRAARTATMSGVGGTMERAFRSDPQLELWRLPEGVNVADAIQRLRADPNVEYAEPDFVVAACQSVSPNDPSFADGSLWGLKNAATVGADINGPAGWAIRHDATFADGSAVIVAVIDTGIRRTHVDLAANMWENTAEIAGNGIDDDGNGYVDDRYGFNAITYTPDNKLAGDPNDDYGHGTHVSGTVGAVGNNGIGVVGVAWRVKLMAVKFLDQYGNGYISDAVEAIDYARVNHAHVMNNSWGGGGASQALREAIQRASDAGIIFAAAAGNASMNCDDSPFYPANYAVENVVAVAATNQVDELTYFSNFGVRVVKLAAPGMDILSAYHLSDTAYQQMSGTSMATPHVSGCLALMRSQFPDDSPARLINRLQNSVRAVSALDGRIATGGVLDLAAALQASSYAPIHDARARAVRLEPNARVSGTNDGATSEAAEPNHGGGSTPRSVWYRLTPVFSRPVTLQLRGKDGFVPVAAVYHEDVGGLFPVGKITPTAYGADLTISPLATETYYVAIDGQGGTSGRYELAVQQQPPNDDFGTAEVISGSNGLASATLGGATAEPFEPRPVLYDYLDTPDFTYGGQSQWFKWTAPSTGKFTFATYYQRASGLYLAFYAGATFAELQRAPVTVVDSIWLVSSAGWMAITTTLTADVTAGTTYYLQVDAGAANEGTGSFRIAWAPTPANVLASDAAVLSGTSGSYHGDSSGAVMAERNLPPVGCGQKAVWFSWTAPRDGRVDFNTFGTTWDTTLEAYSGDRVENYALIAKNDDAADGRQSSLGFLAREGVEYHVRLNGYFPGMFGHPFETPSGAYTLRWLMAATAHDIDSDGYADLVQENAATGEKRIRLMSAAGALGTYTLGAEFAGLRILGTGDFDGDGDADFLASNVATGSMVIAKSEEAASPVMIDLSSWTLRGAVADTADFNADGTTDVVVFDETTGAVGVWLMSGGSPTTYVLLGSLTGGWTVAAAGDFDGDGVPELLEENLALGERRIQYVAGQVLGQTAALAMSGRDIVVVASGDFDGDGKADVVTRDANSGTETVWFLNGATVARTLALGEASGWSSGGASSLSTDPVMSDYDFSDPSADVGTANYAPDRLIVKFRAQASTSSSSNSAAGKSGAIDRTATMAAVGAARLRLFTADPQLELWRLDGQVPVPVAIQRLRADPSVLYAEPDYEIVLSEALHPNDPYFVDGSLWGLRNTGQNYGMAGADINAAEGWGVRHDATLPDGAPVVVAVVDTGIRRTHIDLAANMWENTAEIAGNGVDDDGNGYVDDRYGLNAITYTPETRTAGDANDDYGHGTHVAGTIGAVGNNSTGVVGVAWRVKLMAVKFLDQYGFGYTSDAVEAIDYARTNGAHVINSSWGSSEFSQTLLDAIQRARAANMVLVAAAGNWGGNNDGSPMYPASYALDNIVAVAALGRNNELPYYTNYGATSVDLAAPGHDIVSCGIADDATYVTMSGTSMAAPHVSGAVALMRAQFSDVSPGRLVARLLNAAKPINSVGRKILTGGCLDLAAALRSTNFAPWNNHRVRALPLPTGAWINGTTDGADKEPGEPAHAGQSGGASVWYQFAAPRTQKITITAEGLDGFHPLLSAYFETLDGQMVTVGGIVATTGRATLEVVAQAGRRYYVAVDGADAATGAFRLYLRAPPPHDDFARAAAMVGERGTVSFETRGATLEPGEPTLSSDETGSVWLRWVAPSTGRYTFCAASLDATFFPWLRCFTGDDVGSLNYASWGLMDGFGLQGQVYTTNYHFDVTEGTAYAIQVLPSDRASVAKLTWARTPAEDDFAARRELSGATGAVSGDTSGAGPDIRYWFPTLGLGERDVWFEWTAPMAGRVEFSTVGGAAWDSTLEVFTLSASGQLTALASNDDADGTRQSLVRFIVEQDKRYVIRLNGFSTDTFFQRVNTPGGPYTLRWAMWRDSRDLDGDGFADLIVQGGTEGRAMMRRSVGAESFTETELTGIPANLSIVAAVDLDGAGTADLLLQDLQTGRAAVALMNGTAVASVVYLDALSTSLNLIDAADFDADGKPDLVVQDTVSGEAGIWLMDAGVLLSYVPLPALEGSRIVGAGDVDGDGDADLVVEDPATGGRQVWRMSKTSVAARDALDRTAAGWRVVSVADYDGDRKIDLVLTEPESGALEIWCLDGTRVQSVYSLALGGGSGAVGRVVRSAPAMTRHPSDREVARGQSVSFETAAVATPAPSLQWQSRGSNGTWIDVADGGLISGATTMRLGISAAGPELDQAEYRCRASNAWGTVISGVAKLTVGPAMERPAISQHPGNQTVLRNSAVEFKAVATGYPPPTYQWQSSADGSAWSNLTDGGVYAATSTATLQIRRADATLDGYRFRCVVTNDGGVETTDSATLSILWNAVAPSVITQPVSQTVDAGESSSFVVVATGIPTPQYQWESSADGASWSTISDGGVYAGTQTGTLLLNNVTRSLNGRNYRCLVSNIAGWIYSIPASLTVVLPPSGSAKHSVVGEGYVAGTVTIANSAELTGNFTGMTWQLLLPEGWAFVSDEGCSAEVKPAAGATSLLEWVWSVPPIGPVKFRYTLSVPTQPNGPQQLDAVVVLMRARRRYELLVTPSPLVVQPLHSADTNRDGRIGLLELARVIELYNARHAGARTGAYTVQPGSEDGFAPDASRLPNAIGSLAGYHSADINSDGRISLTELARMIELYNQRSGGTRTGQYHRESGTEDGYAPGP